MRSRRRLMSNSRKHRLCSSFNETESLCANYWAENLQHAFRLFSTKTYTQTSTSDADANRFIGVGGWGGGRHSHPPPKPLGRACEILQRPLCPPPARRLVAHAFFDRTVVDIGRRKPCSVGDASGGGSSEEGEARLREATHARTQEEPARRTRGSARAPRMGGLEKERVGWLRGGKAEEGWRERGVSRSRKVETDKFWGCASGQATDGPERWAGRWPRGVPGRCPLVLFMLK